MAAGAFEPQPAATIDATDTADRRMRRKDINADLLESGGTPGDPFCEPDASRRSSIKCLKMKSFPSFSAWAAHPALATVFRGSRNTVASRSHEIDQGFQYSGVDPGLPPRTSTVPAASITVAVW